MIRLGEKQKLKITRKNDFGVYLSAMDENGGEGVLLPAKEVPEGALVGDTLDVFIYRDSSDRLIATTADPALCLGQTALLQVRQVTKIGAFLDWGLPKDLLLPFKEQTTRVAEGKSYLCALYIDKSNRLCATMKIYEYLSCDCDYKKDDHVTGYIYQIHPTYGAFVAIDGRYHGMVPKKDFFGRHSVGDCVHARVTNVRPDGKLELSLREKIQFQMDIDAEKVMEIIDSYDGVLPFTEKASPEVIERETGMSKAAFKRAVGRLLKNGKIEIIQGKIRIATED